MESRKKAVIPTLYGNKLIEVCCCDIREFDQSIDIFLTSAFYRSYAPTPHTIFYALNEMGISIENLALSPEIDLREFCNVWLSKPFDTSAKRIRRIGCIEMSKYKPDRSGWVDKKDSMLNTLKAFFRMLDIASTQGIEMDTIALPLLGAGSQHITADYIVLPILSECISLLKRNECVKNIIFVDRNPNNIGLISRAIDNSYSMIKSKSEFPKSSTGSEHIAFISYSSKDKNVADNLCAKLEARGLKCWYAPRDINRDNYAQAIVEAIGECTHFVVIISENSLRSEHVLNEIDLAFNETSRHIQFKPIRIDNEELCDAMKYYLSRKHWMDATIPPIEKRLEEFADKLINEC